ncbi:MAG: response regulator transcription factor [Candidatus Sericytochromatia bacterium]|nr:response regulator transcription factor [Candidatus Sericytochromatia bacterium]
MAQLAHILVVEDDPDMALFLELELRHAGYTVDIARDGISALMGLQQQSPELVILDRKLPRLDGLSVCGAIRQHSEVPVLMLTSMDQLSEKVEGLDAGANDYLTKPFQLPELLARVRALLRRSQPPQTQTVLVFADLKIDLLSRQVWRAEEEVLLAAKEFDLLAFLMQHPRQVLSKAQLIQALWGWDYNGEDNIIEVYIHNLRKKLRCKSGRQPLVHTLRGVGYILKEAT